VPVSSVLFKVNYPTKTIIYFSKYRSYSTLNKASVAIPECNICYKYLLCAIILAHSINCWAVTDHSADGVKLAGITVYPELIVVQGYDDNLLQQTSHETETLYTRIIPSASVKAGGGAQQYKLGFRSDAGWHQASNEDNYQDNFLYGEALWSLNHRNAIGFTINYADTHEARGTGISQGASASSFDHVIEFDESDIGLTYILGSDVSEGRLKFSLGRLAKDYTNFTSITDARDRETYSSGINFLWRLGRTGLVLDAEHKNIDYVNDPPAIIGQPDRYDSKQLKLLAGIRWEATGKTSGSIKLGKINKVFDDADREKFSEFSWEAKVNWLPESYARLIFGFARTEQESDAEGSFIDNQTSSIEWQHSWSEDLISATSIYIKEDKYIDDPDNRKDQNVTVNVELNYQLN
jgi:polysaccharide biosynthesis protein VpsM